MYNPYEILGIEKDADKKTIKQAYARLVKQYHPEEQPEEWKRIHDAYELAMKIASGQKQKVSVPVLVESKELAPSTPVETPKVQETDPDGLFGEIEEIAGKQREEEEKALESALDAIRQLAWDKKFKKTEWKEFFDQENLLPIISQKKFLRELGGCFVYNQIGLSLYLYLNKQIEMISEYIKEHNADMTRNQDLAAVRYAKEKVRLAHKHYREEHMGEYLLILGIPIAIAIWVIFITIPLWTEQRKEEQSQSQEVITEWQDELERQQQNIYILE